MNIYYFHLRFSFEKMTHHTWIEDKLGGDHNFQAWNYKVSLILEENDLEQFINREVLGLEGDECKASHNRSMAKAKRITTYSIKDHLVLHVSSLQT